MTDMTQPFNEQDHPRGGSPENPGTFSEKQHADADVTLPAAPAFDRGTNATFGAYDFGGYSYKKLRTMRGEETPAFEADIILEGNAVGGIYSDGLGGMPLPRWASREDRERFETHIRERYTRYWNGERWARLDEPDTFGG